MPVGTGRSAHHRVQDSDRVVLFVFTQLFEYIEN